MDESQVRLPNDHWVSAGLQRNFATEERRVAVIDVASNRVVDERRAVRSNFSERGFTTFLDDGAPNKELEDAFAAIEGSILEEVRGVSLLNRGPNQKAAVANLFAIHLVRSPAYKRFCRIISDEFYDKGLVDIARSPELRAKVEAGFEREHGRPPSDEELFNLAEKVFGSIERDPRTVRGSMARQHNKMAEMLNAFHMQVIEVDPALGGFAIGDTPIVHADLISGRYGFRDRLAIAESTVIVGPLSRRVAVCLSGQDLPSTKFRVRKKVDTLNALVVRAAASEVACHPDDARQLVQVCRRLDRLPESYLFGSLKRT